MFVLNGGVALLAGFAAAVQWKLSMGDGLAIAATTFAGLTVCLLSRAAAMAASLTAASLVGSIAAFVCWVLVSEPVASQFAACLGGASGFGLVFVLYRRLARSTTGAGDLEGLYTGTFNERDEKLRKGSGAATVVVSATEEADHDLLLTGLVVGGLSVDLYGVRREDETVSADLGKGRAITAPFVLLRGKASVHEGGMLIVDLEGSPFGSYVFTGKRARR